MQQHISRETYRHLGFSIKITFVPNNGFMIHRCRTQDWKGNNKGVDPDDRVSCCNMHVAISLKCNFTTLIRFWQRTWWRMSIRNAILLPFKLLHKSISHIYASVIYKPCYTTCSTMGLANSCMLCFILYVFLKSIVQHLVCTNTIMQLFVSWRRLSKRKT